MDIDSSTRLRRSGATWSLLAVTGGLTAAAVFAVVQSVLRATGVVAVTDEQSLDSGIGQYGLFGAEGLRTAEGLSLLVTVPIAVACLVLLVGLVRFRPWAREGVLGMFGLGGSCLLLFAVAGTTQDTLPLSALALAFALLAAAALTLTPGVRDDLEARRLQEELRAREAATAARRARETAAGSGATSLRQQQGAP